MKIDIKIDAFNKVTINKLDYSTYALLEEPLEVNSIVKEMWMISGPSNPSGGIYGELVEIYPRDMTQDYYNRLDFRYKEWETIDAN